MHVLKTAVLNIREFTAFDRSPGLLWPRWLVLRAIGIVYVLIFAGILDEGRALIGADGLLPLAQYSETLAQIFPNPAERVLRAPSLFLIDASPGMIVALEWIGMAAAIALILNLWPRMALFVCWAAFLSFVSMWRLFSPTIIDPLLLEAALLSIVFAPAGFRPGLGADSPPRAIAVFMMRWLLFRIMLGSGLIKVFAGDPSWRDLTAMDRMNETNPSPTVLGYFDFHMPHAWHVFQIGLTLAAEIAGPFLALFCGRRGRWIAFALWIGLQGGIQLTGNFGWLNTSAIALGLLLLDDGMIAAAARTLRLRGIAERVAAVAKHSPAIAPPPRTWATVAITVLLWVHFALSIHAFATVAGGTQVVGRPDPFKQPVAFLFRDFKFANGYVPFASFPEKKYEVEFAGSNDGGVTWRPYPYRFKPQREDRMPPFTSPWFGRFDASMQLALATNSPVVRRVAEKLLQGNPDVTGLFEADPFTDRPPQAIRVEVYRFTFTDRATRRTTGRYWNKEYVADFCPPLVLDVNRRIPDGG